MAQRKPAQAAKPAEIPQACKPEKEPRKDLGRPRGNVLHFSPTSWAKLLFFRDRGESEIGGLGIGAADDLLRIEEFVTVRQKATMASVSLDDQAVSDLFDAQVDAGRRPAQFARIWLHSHPGDSPYPSGLDEDTFHRVFGRCEWAVLFILARTGQTYARLRFNVGPGGEMVIPVEVDYRSPFGPSDHDAWEAEYMANMEIEVDPLSRRPYGTQPVLAEAAFSGCLLPNDWLEGLDTMDPAQRELILDELADWRDPWADESEVNL